MSIRDQYGRHLVGASLSDWRYNITDGRDLAIVYEGGGGCPRVIDTSVDPGYLLPQAERYRSQNPDMPIRIMSRKGEVYPPKSSKIFWDGSSGTPRAQWP